MKYVVYIIQNKINLKIYIGKTGANPYSKRWAQHLKIARNPKAYKAMPVQYAIHKYGEENFTFTLLEEFDSADECSEAEIFWIQLLRSWDDEFGYNLTLGGEGTIPTELTREKMRRSALKNRSKQTVLTIKNVEEIKQLLLSGKFSQKSIAEKFHVRPQTIGLIAKNKIFKDVVGTIPFLDVAPGYQLRKGEKNSQAKFSQEEADIIRKEFDNGKRVKDLSEKYGCSRQLINRIVHNKSYL